jgi:hypothetical protein
MIADDDSSSRPGSTEGPVVWPVVSPGTIVIAEWDCDLAYMGFYLRLEICNRSPYLVREAELRIDGFGRGTQRVVTSRAINVGPLLPGEYIHEEVGIGAREGIQGLSFNSVKAQAVRLTPPAGMVPAAQYSALVAEIVDVTVDEEAPDLRRHWDDVPGEARKAVGTAIRVRVRNTGPVVVDRVRLKLQYFEAHGQEGSPREWVAEWILDMPHEEWNPYQLPAAPEVFCRPAHPLQPGQAHEFTLVHYDGGPHGWAGSLDAVSVEVVEMRLRT